MLKKTTLTKRAVSFALTRSKSSKKRSASFSVGNRYRSYVGKWQLPGSGSGSEGSRESWNFGQFEWDMSNTFQDRFRLLNVQIVLDSLTNTD